MVTSPNLTVLVLDFLKPEETKICLESIEQNLKVPHTTVLLDNGGAQDYAWQYYKYGLCDTIISKKKGFGGGVGQTDLFRWCTTTYALFVQNDQYLNYTINQENFDYFTKLLEQYHCIDLNGDQSNRGVWTDRAHLIKTDFFNSLGPFPNGGPGFDAIRWNEQYLQEVFKEKGYKIAHIKPALFIDIGKWSIREAGDGLYKHRTDTKEFFVEKTPTYKTEVYPPFTDAEWSQVIAGKWINGTIPEKWKEHSFKVWN